MLHLHIIELVLNFIFTLNNQLGMFAGCLLMFCLTVYAVQGVYADIHVHDFRGEVQGAC